MENNIGMDYKKKMLICKKCKKMFNASYVEAAYSCENSPSVYAHKYNLIAELRHCPLGKW